MEFTVYTAYLPVSNLTFQLSSVHHLLSGVSRRRSEMIEKGCHEVLIFDPGDRGTDEAPRRLEVGLDSDLREYVDEYS